MFDKIIRELNKLSREQEVFLPRSLDEKGYIDRQCPSENCRGSFKVEIDDWQTKVLDERAICPFCRHEAPRNTWSTDAQVRQDHSLFISSGANLVNHAIKRAVRNTKPKILGGGNLSATASLTTPAPID